MEWSVVRDVILFLVAIYGAALSTFNWRQAVRRERRLVRVTMATKMVTYSDGSLGPPFAQIEAANIGHRPVTIDSLFIELPGGKRMFATSHDAFPERDSRLPIELGDGGTVRLYMPYADIGNALHSAGIRGEVNLTPAASDSAGGTHRGTPWKTSGEALLRVGR